MTKQQYNKKICGFKNRSDLYFFPSNTLLSIKYSGYLHCYLNNGRNCQICSTRADFCNFENEVIDNMFNTQLLKNCLTKLYPYLSKLFYEHKSSICCFLDFEFSYTIRRQSGQIQSIVLLILLKKLKKMF